MGSSSAVQVESSTNSQSPSTGTDNDPDDDVYCHCPFKHFDDCHDGVGGRGYMIDTTQAPNTVLSVRIEYTQW